MTNDEKEAFVKAYSTNVAAVSTTGVRAFLDLLDGGEDVDYSHDYMSIMDALGMWHEGAKFALTNMKAK